MAPTTRLEGINSAMFNIYTALGTTTVDLTGTTYCTWTGVTCDSDNIEPTVIDLSFIYSGGYLATDIGMITDLTLLALGYNSLTGSLPAELNNNVNLVRLFLRGNYFTGVLPDLSGLSAIDYLALGYNQLTGTINSSELPTTALRILNLARNEFTGVLPDFSGFSAIDYLSLAWNDLTGTINHSLLPPNLTGLYFPGNLVTGSIPDFSGLTAMTRLSLAANNLSSSIPDASSFPSTLGELDLGGNDLTGVLPDLSSLSLSDLVLDNTLLDEQSLPDWLFGVWFYINMVDNQFTGNIPASIGSSTAQLVWLAGNQFTGPLPNEISGMTSTWDFWVADNALTGEIPAGVDNFNLDYYFFFFDITNNAAMTGTAPTLLCAEDYFYYDGTSVTCT